MTLSLVDSLAEGLDQLADRVGAAGRVASALLGLCVWERDQPWPEFVVLAKVAVYLVRQLLSQAVHHQLLHQSREPLVAGVWQIGDRES